MKFAQIFLFCVFFETALMGESVSQKKILICGVCKDTAFAAVNSIDNIEKLGAKFSDYRALIYENNSTDGTDFIYKEWAQQNNRVVFQSEVILEADLALSRTERIANSRNHLLSWIKEPQYDEFQYVVMVDS